MNKEERNTMNQKEIDEILKYQDELSGYDEYELKERAIDKKFGIKRRPELGWLISCIGSIIVWSIVLMVIWAFIR
jgi:hypothetical protein